MTKFEKEGQKGNTRQRILDVARGIFARRGYEGTSVDAIVKASALNKGALYWHFRDKAELYREIMREQLKSLRESFMLSEKMKGNIDLRSYLIERGMVLIDGLQKDPECQMLWLDLLIVAQRGDTTSRILAEELIDSILASVFSEVDAALLPEWDLKCGSLDMRERILCLIYFWGSLVANLGVRLEPEEAKHYWEIVTRMFLEEGCSHEAS